jgi:hypothetical protein
MTAAAAGAAAATMTDARKQAPRRVARSNRPAYLAYGGSAVAFAAVLGVLGWQVATGADPAIGEAEPAAAPAQRMVVRRIVRRVIVTRDAPAQTSAPAAPAPAEQPATPAPAPAPAPPPTTRAS